MGNEDAELLAGAMLGAGFAPTAKGQAFSALRIRPLKPAAAQA